MSVGTGLETSYADVRPRSRRVGVPLVTAGLVSATTVALRFRDPHVHGSWGLCPFKLLTGWDCPGCGSLRAVNDLTHGDLLGAASSNLVLVLAIPFALAGWGLWLRRSWTGEPRPGSGLSRAGGLLALALLVTALVAFTVARNTVAGAWLHS